MYIIREDGKQYGIFKAKGIDLIGMVDCLDELSGVIRQAVNKDNPTFPISQGITIKIPNDNIESHKKSEMPSNCVVTDRLNVSLEISEIEVTATHNNRKATVGSEHSTDLAENIKHAIELVLDKELCAQSWLSVGKPYWYVVAPSPLYAAVNKGIIDQDILDELEDSDELGNIFRTREEAIEVARKMSNLFERN